MSADIGSMDPGNCVEDVWFESAVRAVRAYLHARLMRKVVVFSTFALFVVRAAFPAWFAVEGHSPFVSGMSLAASFFTIMLEWSTRAQCCDRLDQISALSRPGT
ncbi:MAG TPA: hypothetical protein VMR25_24185 [Planctomycetaceae bacterium]|jgi:hypothetical protein|nr:hypothetical protein [Planctomycetaceae bacterium]